VEKNGIALGHRRRLWSVTGVNTASSSLITWPNGLGSHDPHVEVLGTVFLCQQILVISPEGSFLSSITQLGEFNGFLKEINLLLSIFSSRASHYMMCVTIYS
jgi:hypothetical protein